MKVIVLLIFMELNLLQHLYLEQKKSMQEIADMQKVSLTKVAYWLNKHKIKSRPRSEALYVKNNPNGDPFKIIKVTSKEDNFLLGLGLGLWWGEGSKRHKHAVRIGNSDPMLIKSFMKFMVEIMGVNKNKFRFGLQVFSDLNVTEVKSKWINALEIEESQFFPTTIVTPKRGKGNYKNINEWGVVTLYYSNIKLRLELEKLCLKYLFSSNSL